MVTNLLVYLAAYVFVSSVFGNNIPIAEFAISPATACWDIERKWSEGTGQPI
jgi:hypothetical protein